MKKKPVMSDLDIDGLVRRGQSSTAA